MNSASLPRVVLSAVAGLIVTMAYCVPGLYADGPYILLQLLLNRDYFIPDPARIVTIYVTQTPVLLAIRAGFENLGLLIYLQTLGLLAPLLAWFAALTVQRNEPFFWVLVTAFCVTFLTGGMVIIGEYNFGAALVGLVAAVLLKSDKLKARHAILLLLAAAGLIKAYESTVFLGPMLIACACLRIHERRDRGLALACIFASVVALLIGTAFAAASVLNPIKPHLLAGATNFGFLLRSPHFIYLAAMSAALIAAIMLDGRKRSIVMGFACVVSVVYIAIPRWWNPPYRHYEFRALSALMMFALLGLCLMSRLAERFGYQAPTARARPVALACLIATAIPFLTHLFGFRAWVTQFEKVVMTNRGILPIDQTALFPSPFAWNWTNPSLSAVLRAGGEGAIIANARSYKEWEPFAAANAPKIDLPKHKPIF